MMTHLDSLIPDDRLRCRDCRHYTAAGECQIAAQRRLMYRRDPESVTGDFPRSTYHPRPELLRRCEFGAEK